LRQQTRGHEGTDFDFALTGGIRIGDPFVFRCVGRMVWMLCSPSRKPTSRITTLDGNGGMEGVSKVQAGRSDAGVVLTLDIPSDT
jgi:hypothetical protein